jgi:deazaflavin-dependent oxidoreductase (nitroreductase family)
MAHLAEHYQRPGWFTTNVFNRFVAALTRLGVSVYGSRVLEVRGRKSGEWRQTPVNLLRYDGAEYLVAPRGQTQWVKNLRASGQGRLRVGRRTQSFDAVELADDEKPPLLRAYLKKSKFRGRRLFRRCWTRLFERGIAPHRTRSSSLPRDRHLIDRSPD